MQNSKNFELPLSYTDLVLKLNDSRTKFNKRILCVKDDVLFYYDMVPSKYHSNNFESLNGSPKAGVLVEDILKVNAHTHKKISCFSVEFPKNKMITYKTKKLSIMQKVRMSFLSSKPSNLELSDKKYDGKVIKWIFSTKGSEEPETKLQFWLKFLYNAKLSVATNKIISEDSIANKEVNSTFGNSARIVDPKKQYVDDYVDEVQESPRKEKNPIEIPIIIETPPQETLMKKSPKHQKKLQKIFDKLQTELNYSWDFRYYTYLNQFLKEIDLKNSTLSPPQTESQMQIFSLIGEFKNFSLKTTQEIIDQFSLPKYLQSYDKYLKFQNGLFFENEYLQYEIKEKNISIRICSYLNSSQKAINRLKHEFKTIKYLSDKLVSMKIRKQDYEYYLPLSCKIYYKGFLALVMSIPPIEEKAAEKSFPTNNDGKNKSNAKNNTNTLLKNKNAANSNNNNMNINETKKNMQTYDDNQVFGPTKEGHFIFDKKIYNDQVLLAKALNLKEDIYIWNRNSDHLPLPLSILTQVHKANMKSWTEFTAFQNIKTIEDLNFLLGELKKEDPKKFDIFYLKNIADTFPLDVGFSNDFDEILLYGTTRFRPEFIENYKDPLSSNIFLSPMKCKENEMNDIEGVFASEYLLTKTIEKFLKNLQEFKVTNIPITGENLSKLAHKAGINMRYLGKIAETCKKQSFFFSFIKDLCEIEMIARTCKEIFWARVQEVIKIFWKSKFFVEEPLNLSSNNLTPISDCKTPNNNLLQASFENSSENENEQEMPGLNHEYEQDNSDFAIEVQKELMREIREEVISFFNLLFGKGRENEAFWKEILLKKIQNKFHYEFQLDNFQNIYGLYRSLLFHLKLDMKNKKKLSIFEEEAPFQLKDFMNFKSSIESLDLLALREIFAENLVFQSETEKRMESFDCCSATFCKIIDQYIENAKYKKASEEIEALLRKQKENECLICVEILKVLYLKLKLQFKEKKNKEIFETIKEILDILTAECLENHPIYSIFYCIFAQFFYLQGDYANSLMLFQSSLLAYQKIDGADTIFLVKNYEYLSDIYKKCGKKQEEFEIYNKIFQTYLPKKLIFQKEFCDIATKLAYFNFEKANYSESINFCLECIEILEINGKESFENLISCYLLVLKNAVNLKEHKVILTFCDCSFRVLNEMNEKKHNVTYVYILECLLTTLLSELDNEKKIFFNDFFRDLTKIVHDNGDKRKNIEDFLQIEKIQALEFIINEAKLFEKFSIFLSHHLEFVFSTRKESFNNDFVIQEKNLESRQSQKIFEKIMYLINPSKIFDFLIYMCFFFPPRILCFIYENYSLKDSKVLPHSKHPFLFFKLSKHCLQNTL